MIRVRSTHGAPCCGVPPRAEGDVDESNRGVAAALAGGLLVRVEAEKVPAVESLADSPSAHVLEVEAALASASSRFSIAEAAAAQASERIAALEAENARLHADLDGLLSAPAAPPPASKKKPAPPSEG